ncbi:MAG TPA: FtsX-like permease family protein [Pirellulales bacterium]|nr:FtsX-like permease family protein [Pirellulales bacterium]
MRPIDLVTLPLAALWQQKTRTCLTTLGVVFGAFVLSASLSINDGVQQTISRESGRDDVLRRIDVFPSWRRQQPAAPAEEVVVEGKMSDAKRARIRQALAAYNARQTGDDNGVMLTPETLGKLAGIKHVLTVEPDARQSAFANLNGHSESLVLNSARPGDPAHVGRLVAGRFLEDPSEHSAVVSEFLLYRCGITDEESVESILGKKLRVEVRRSRQQPGITVYLVKPDGAERTREEAEALAKVARGLPMLLDKLGLTPDEVKLLRPDSASEPSELEDEYVDEFSVVGVVRDPDEREKNDRRWWESNVDGEVFLPYQAAADFFFRFPQQREWGVSSARLLVDRLENVKEVFRQVKELGLTGNAAIEFIERERFQWLMVFGGMTCVAAVALMVAAMGIANTMLMSVLERTREIGIMKAVGAAGAHIQFIFLAEGALIGAVGGALGLLMAWAVSYPGDAWVRSMVAREMNIELKQAIFVFPPWLALTVMLFALLVTTLAAVYPAWRAARIDPVAALRHE